MQRMAPASALVTPERSEVDLVYTWDLSAIFPSWEAWDGALADRSRARLNEVRVFSLMMLARLRLRGSGAMLTSPRATRSATSA